MEDMNLNEKPPVLEEKAVDVDRYKLTLQHLVDHQKRVRAIGFLTHVYDEHSRDEVKDLEEAKALIDSLLRDIKERGGK